MFLTHSVQLSIPNTQPSITSLSHSLALSAHITPPTFFQYHSLPPLPLKPLPSFISVILPSPLKPFSPTFLCIQLSLSSILKDKAIFLNTLSYPPSIPIRYNHPHVLYISFLTMPTACTSNPYFQVYLSTGVS